MPNDPRPPRIRSGSPDGLRRVPRAGRPGRSAREDVLHLVVLPGDEDRRTARPVRGEGGRREDEVATFRTRNERARDNEAPLDDLAARRERRRPAPPTAMITTPAPAREPQPTRATTSSTPYRASRPSPRARRLAAEAATQAGALRAPTAPSTGSTSVRPERSRSLDERPRTLEERRRRPLDDEIYADDIFVLPEGEDDGDDLWTPSPPPRPNGTSRSRREPAPKRRRDAKRRRGAADAPTGGHDRGRRQRPPVDRHDRHRHLYNRRTVAGILCTAVLLLGALFVIAQPMRLWKQQRTEEAAAAAELAQIRSERGHIADELEVLATPAEVKRRARFNLNMAEPGDELVTVLPPPIEPLGLPDTWPFTGIERELAAG